jgi:heme-degrading monooxygenase HmoA
MVRSVLYLQPRDGAHDALVDFYRRYDVLATAVRAAGCRTTELHVPLDGDGPALVTALWDDEAAYQGWVDHDLRGANGDELMELIDVGDRGVPTGRVYRVAVAAAGPGWIPAGPENVSAGETPREEA